VQQPSTASVFLKRVKLFVILILFSALVFVAVLSLREQFEVLARLELRIADLDREIQMQESITVELIRQHELVGAPGQMHREHIERVAREVLGMVHRDEIIFRPRQ